MKADQANIRTVEVHDRAGNVVGSKDVVLYAGLLSQAHEEGLTRVRTSILQIPTEENRRLAIVKAEVETSKGLFEAIGDVVAVVGPKLRQEHREHFLVLLLNARHEVMAKETVSVGSLNASIVHPREVFRPAVLASAAAVVLVA